MKKSVLRASIVALVLLFTANVGMAKGPKPRLEESRVEEGRQYVERLYSSMNDTEKRDRVIREKYPDARIMNLEDIRKGSIQRGKNVIIAKEFKGITREDDEGNHIYRFGDKEIKSRSGEHIILIAEEGGVNIELEGPQKSLLEKEIEKAGNEFKKILDSKKAKKNLTYAPELDHREKADIVKALKAEVLKETEIVPEPECEIEIETDVFHYFSEWYYEGEMPDLDCEMDIFIGPSEFWDNLPFVKNGKLNLLQQSNCNVYIHEVQGSFTVQMIGGFLHIKAKADLEVQTFGTHLVEIHNDNMYGAGNDLIQLYSPVLAFVKTKNSWNLPGSVVKIDDLKKFAEIRIDGYMATLNSYVEVNSRLNKYTTAIINAGGEITVKADACYVEADGNLTALGSVCYDKLIVEGSNKNDVMNIWGRDMCVSGGHGDDTINIEAWDQELDGTIYVNGGTGDDKISIYAHHVLNELCLDNPDAYLVATCHFKDENGYSHIYSTEDVKGSIIAGEGFDQVVWDTPNLGIWLNDDSVDLFNYPNIAKPSFIQIDSIDIKTDLSLGHSMYFEGEINYQSSNINKEGANDI